MPSHSPRSGKNACSGPLFAEGAARAAAGRSAETVACRSQMWEISCSRGRLAGARSARSATGSQMAPQHPHQPLRSPPMPVQCRSRPGRRSGLGAAAAAAGGARRGARGLRLLAHQRLRRRPGGGAVPASAPLYAGAVVRPEGALKDAASAAGRTLTRQADPYLRLLSALQTPGSPPLDFKQRRRALAGPQRRDLHQLARAPPRRSKISGLLSALARDLLGRLLRPRTHSRSPPTASRARSCSTPANAGKARSFLELPGRATPARTRSATGESPSRPPPKAPPSPSCDGFAVIGSEARCAQRDRHHARGTLARACDRLLEAGRRSAVGNPRPHLRQPDRLRRAGSRARRSSRPG